MNKPELPKILGRPGDHVNDFHVYLNLLEDWANQPMARLYRWRDPAAGPIHPPKIFHSIEESAMTMQRKAEAFDDMARLVRVVTGALYSGRR